MKEIKINDRYYYELECERCKKIFTKRKDYYKISLKKCNGRVLCKNCAGMKYDENITEKPCTKCKKIKSLNEFRKRKNGLRSECKECESEYVKMQGKIYREKNKDALIKKQKGEEIYGCSVNKLIEHLIKTYENNYNEKWNWKYLKNVHVDHVIPLASANTEEDVKKLCHYTNLQLLKAKDNLDKKDSLEWELK